MRGRLQDFSLVLQHGCLLYKQETKDEIQTSYKPQAKSAIKLPSLCSIVNLTERSGLIEVRSLRIDVDNSRRRESAKQAASIPTPRQIE